MKRATSVILVSMIVALLSGVATAAQPAARGNGPIVPLFEKAYSYDITVPAFGTVRDTEKYTMTNGKYCKCYLQSSGGWAISVRALDYNTSEVLSGWVGVDQGQTKLIWTNNTGVTRYIRFELTSAWPFSIRAIGSWLFGPF